jgi:glutamine synthetase
MTPAEVLSLIKEKQVKFADLRFTDTRGKEQHVSVPARLVNEDFFTDGKMFDGSSIAGWKGINESDMILMPDPDTAVIDPFFEETTLLLRCDVVEPTTMQGYERDPRSIAKRAEAYLKSTGIADSVLFGPENEFFIFDSVRMGSGMSGCFYEIDSVEAAWSSGRTYTEGNKGHRPGVKGGYFPVPPVDSQQDIRSAMCMALEELGLKVEVHHHEVATAGQGEINVAANTLTKKADEVQILKYGLHNVADMARRSPSCPSRSSATTATACTCTSRSPRAARTFSPARSTAASPTSRSTTSAASSSTPRRSTPSPTRAPTATSAWCLVSKRR